MYTTQNITRCHGLKGHQIIVDEQFIEVTFCIREYHEEIVCNVMPNDA
jgi:hypothetical protein